MDKDQQAVANFVKWAVGEAQKSGKGIAEFLDGIMKDFGSDKTEVEPSPGESNGMQAKEKMTPKDMMKMRMMGKM
jgi:hypothetical protein